MLLSLALLLQALLATTLKLLFVSPDCKRRILPRIAERSAGATVFYHDAFVFVEFKASGPLVWVPVKN